MSKRISVTFPESKLIPTIGKGPINRPISITQEQFNMLTSLGYKVVQAGEVKKVEKIETPAVEAKEPEVTPEDPAEDEIETPEEEVEEEPEVEVEEDEEALEEEQVEEEPTEEEVEETESDDKAYSEKELDDMNKDELKALLDSRGVKYAYKDTVATLTKAALDSNPEA
jgi:hypothetical protein